MSRMDAAEYLGRIRYAGPDTPTAATLAALQAAHLYTVPFENLDIHLGRTIVLDVERFYDKVAVRGRGGFCYELNGLFAWLLEQLGFGVTLLSARDVGADGRLGPEYDHLVLAVTCPGEPGAWLADVGWGDSFREPLPLDLVGEKAEGRRAYGIEHNGEARTVWQRRYDGRWEPQYRFTLTPRRLAEFAETCRYHQTSPESHFTRGRIVTLATPDGRISLDEHELVITVDGARRERAVAEAEREALLAEHFGIRL